MSPKNSSQTSPQNINKAILKEKNGLNEIRLILASLVIVSHAPLQVMGDDVQKSIFIEKIESIGTLCVILFFCISGYLITASAQRGGFVRYSVNRALRIYPGYWGSLIFVAFIAAPVAARAGYSLSDWSIAQSLKYLAGNWNLYGPGFSWQVGSTPHHLPINVWNGPIWTLRYEVLMYLLLALVAFSPIIRFHQRGFITFLFAASSILVLVDQFTSFSFPFFENFPWLLNAFLSGSLVFVWGNKINLNIILSASLLLLSVSLFFLAPRLALIVSSLPLTYGILGVSKCISCKTISRNDISYGVYIYGWPVQQLLIIFNSSPLGLPLNILLTLAITYGIASASWHLIEKPSLSIKKNSKS